MTRQTIKNWRWAALALALTLLASVGAATRVLAQNTPPGSDSGLGQLSGLLPRDHLTTESAIQANLSTETERLPLYTRAAYCKPPCFILLHPSPPRLPHNLER